MKKRTGFVSNSSSSSFIIKKNDLKVLSSTKFDEKHALEYAKECTDNQQKWFVDYPEHRKTETFDYDKEFNKQYNHCLNNHVILLNDIEKEHYNNQSVYTVAENYKYNEDDVFQWKDNKLTWNDYFNKYEIADLGSIYYKFSLSIYYKIKKELDNPTKRKKLYEAVYYTDIGYANITEYPVPRRGTKHEWRKRDIARFKNYKKKYYKMSSYNFYRKVIQKEIIENWIGSGWNSWLNIPNEKLPKSLQQVMFSLDKEMFNALDSLVTKFINKNLQTDYVEFEYSDGGGCGTTAPLLEHGMYFEQVDYIRISHH